MNSRTETLASRVAARFAQQLQPLPSVPGELGYEVSAAELLNVCRTLRDDSQFGFQQLIDLSGVDYLDYGRDEWNTLASTATGFSRGVNRIKESTARSKVMILLTDGVNKRGEIGPLTAAQLAQTFGIRIYTIGVGTIGEAPYPVQTPFGIRYQNVPVDVDEKSLKAIADMTGAEYFRATNNRALERIYAEIDKLEKIVRFILDIHRGQGGTYPGSKVLSEGIKSIVMIEHDMGIIMDIADRVVVLDFGDKIAEGSPEEIRSDRKVIDACLGTEA